MCFSKKKFLKYFFRLFFHIPIVNFAMFLDRFCFITLFNRHNLSRSLPATIICRVIDQAHFFLSYIVFMPSEFFSLSLSLSLSKVCSDRQILDLFRAMFSSSVPVSFIDVLRSTMRHRFLMFSVLQNKGTCGDAE
jgi:hypothetical protein